MSDSTPARRTIEVAARGLVPRTDDDYWRMAQAVVKARLAPKGMESPEAVFVAMQIGSEAGLTPMRALMSVNIINGRPSWPVEVAKALIRANGALRPGTDFTQRIVGEGDEMNAIVTCHRAGVEEPFIEQFSVSDAKTAGLWKKAGPWSQYPKRMLVARAWGFLFRDHFQDVLIGLSTYEEARDIEEPLQSASPGVVIHAEVQTEDPLLLSAPQEGGESAGPDGPPHALPSAGRQPPAEGPGVTSGEPLVLFPEDTHTGENDDD